MNHLNQTQDKKLFNNPLRQKTKSLGPDYCYKWNFKKLKLKPTNPFLPTACFKIAKLALSVVISQNGAPLLIRADR